MAERAPTKSSRGAVATGASATGAASLAAMAMGAMALGALAVGAVAIGRLSVGRARLRKVEIGELTVGRLDVRSEGAGGRVAAAARVRAAPGRGDAFERLIVDEAGGAYRAHRSRVDPDLFLFLASRADRAASDRAGRARLYALLRKAARQELVVASTVEVELYRPVQPAPIPLPAPAAGASG
jgi:hypothetical protein